MDRGMLAIPWQAAAQRREVLDVVAGAGGFRTRSGRGSIPGLAARRMVQQALAALRRCAGLLRELLAPRQYAAVAGALVETITAAVAGADRSSPVKACCVCQHSRPRLPSICQPRVKEQT